MHALIEADGLSKKFGKVQALSDLTLTLPAGQPVAILGPNGAGKTTFIRMVATLHPARPRARCVVDGHDVVRDPMAVRRMIGLAGQSAAVEEMMTGPGEPGHGGPPLRPGPAAEASARPADPRADGSGGGRRPPGPDLFRRHATAARPRGEPGRLAPPAAARRADHRARPGQSQRGVGRHPGDELGRDRHRADDAVSRRGRPPGRPPSSSSTAGRVIAQGTPDELKSRVGADMVELHTVDVPTMQRAAEVLGVARHGRAGHRPGDAAVLHRRAGRLASCCPIVVRALDEAAVAGGGHRAAPAHPRRGVPGPDRARHAPTRRPEGGRSMTMDLTLDPPRQAAGGRTGGGRRTRGRRISSPRRRWRAGPSRSSSARPALIVAGTAQGVLFLLIFRYVFGGAVAHTGSLVLRGLPGAGLRRHRRAVPGHERGERRGRRPGGRALRPAAQPAHPAAVASSRDGWAPTRRSWPGASSS